MNLKGGGEEINILEVVFFFHFNFFPEEKGILRNNENRHFCKNTSSGNICFT